MARATSGRSTFGEWWTNGDGSQTERLFTEPTFRRVDGSWERVDATVREAPGAAAFAAESAVVPTRFYGEEDRVVEFATEKGPLALAARDLSIGEPTLSKGVIEYADVAKDTDLRYRLSADSVKEEIVLGSSASPRSYRFHLSDPSGFLGDVARQPDGSWRFAGEVGPDLALVLPPAFAYEDKGPRVPAPVDLSSASLEVRRAGDGYDLTISVDAAWLKGKEFPIVLDPTLTLTGSSGVAIDGVTSSAAGGGNSVSTAGTGLVAGTTSSAAWRTFMRFNISQIPYHAPVSSAQLGLFNDFCLGDWGGAGCPATGYSLGVRSMTGAWSASSTWNQLAALISSTDLASAAGQANVVAGWQTFDLTSQVQKWVNLEDANNGIALRVADESLGRSGPWWESSEGTDPATRPYLQVTYSANPSNGYPPTAPPSVYSFGGGVSQTIGTIAPAPRRALFEPSDHSFFTWYKTGSEYRYAQWDFGGPTTPKLPASGFNSFATGIQDATGAADSIWALGSFLTGSQETRWDYSNGAWSRSGGSLGGTAVGSPALGRGPLTTWRDSRNGRIWAAYLEAVAEGTTTKTHLFTAQSSDGGATFGSAADLGAPLGATTHSAQFVPLASGGVGLLVHADGLRWYPSATGAASTVVFTPTAPQTELTMSWQAAATDDGIVHLLVASPGSPVNHYRLVAGAWSLYSTIESGYRDLSLSTFGEGLWLATNEVSQIRLRRFETETGAWDSGRVVASGVAGRPSLPERSNRYHLPILWNRPNSPGPYLLASRYDDLGPIIEMVGPGDGSLLTGNVTVRALADDPGLGAAGVQRMDFFVDRGNGAIGYLGSDSTPDTGGEFSYTWNTDASDGGSGKLWPSGAYRIYTVGWDYGGNRSESGRLTGYIDRKDLGLHAARPSSSLTVGDVTATVNLVNGNLVVTQTDAAHPTVIGPLSLARTFNSQDLADRKVGPGWALSADVDVELIFRELVDYSGIEGVPSGTISLVEPDGTEHFYFADGKGGYVPFFEDSSVLKGNGDGTWTLVLLDGTRYEFGSNRKLLKIVPAQGNQASFAYTYNGSGELTSITEPGGRSVTLTYAGGKVATVSEFDPAKQWTYTYTSGRLTRVTDPGGTFTQFGYDTAGRINQITDRSGSILFVDYDGSGRVAAFRQRHVISGSPVDYTTSFEYTNATTSKVVAFRGNLAGCDATCKTFYTTTYTYDAQRRVTAVARKLPDGSTVSSTSGWDELANLGGARRPRNLLTSKTDFLGRRTDNFYDEVGNLTKTTDPAGTTTRRYDEGYGGLTAEYFPNTSLTPSAGFPIRRLDATVDFDWGGCATPGTCSPHASIPVDNFSARWTGWVDVPTSGSWTFSTEVDDGVRLYVDGNLLLDYWTPSSTVRTAAPIVLKAGLHEITLLHFEGAVAAKMKLRWKGPGVSTQIIPASRLKPGLGLMTSMTGPDGHPSSTTYDGPFTKHVIEESETNTDLDGTVTTVRTRYDYTDPSTGQPDGFGRLHRKTLPNGNTGATANPAYSTVYAYYGLTEAATDPCTGASANQAGQLKSETAGTAGTVTPISHVYDIRGNEVATIDGNGTACTAYNARSQRTSFKAADRATPTTYTVTPDGLPDTVLDPMAGNSDYDYDDLDRLVAATDVFGGTTTYAYDSFTPAGQMTTVTDPSGVRVSTTDQAGRQSQLTFTPTGGTTQTYTFTYDATDNLDVATYPNGATVDRDYDTAGRLNALRNHTSAGAAIADYTLAHDAASRRTIEDGPSGRWRYAYDSIGRLERVHDPRGYTRRYRFDRNTNRTGLETAAGLHWERGTAVHSTTLGTPLAFVNTDNGYSTLTLPFAFPLYGQTYSQVYVSSNGYLTTSSNTSAQPDLDTTRGLFPFAKDQKIGNGAVTTRQDDLLNPTWIEIRWYLQPQSAAATDTTHYNDFAVRLYNDGRIRYTYGAVTDGSGARVGYSAGDGWNFGDIGGLDGGYVPAHAPSVEITPHTATSTSATYDAIDRWTAPGVTYDTVGNTSTIDATAFTYDARNLLTATTTATQSSAFVFDGEGRQVKSTTAGTERRLRYGAPGDPGANYETDASNNVTVAAVAGPPGLLATYTGTTPSYYFTSPRGDTAATMDATGATTALLFDEYGNPAGPAPTYGFVGGFRKQHDPVTGVTLMGARAYSSVIGRFLETDPIEGGSANDYDYVNADPVNSFDLDGTCSTNNKGFGARLRNARCRASRAAGRAWNASGGKVVHGVSSTAGWAGRNFSAHGLNNARNRIWHGISRNRYARGCGAGLVLGSPLIAGGPPGWAGAAGACGAGMLGAGVEQLLFG